MSKQFQIIMVGTDSVGDVTFPYWLGLRIQSLSIECQTQWLR